MIEFLVSFNASDPRDYLEIRDGSSQLCSEVLTRYGKAENNKDNRYPPLADNITLSSSGRYVWIKYYGGSTSNVVVNFPKLVEANGMWWIKKE